MKSIGRDLFKLVVYAHVVRTGSFTRAADALDISRSVVSKHIDDLEESLSVRLLNRTTRTVTMTDVGSMIYQHAENIMSEYSEIASRSSSEHSIISGNVRISMPIDFGATTLMPILADIKRQHPELHMEIMFDNRAVNLLEENVDVAIRVGWLKEENYPVRKLGSTEHWICASESFGNQVQSLNHQTLVSLPWIQNSQLSRRIQMNAPDKSKVFCEPAATITCNTAQATRLMVLENLGLSLFPAFYVYDDIKQGRMIRVLDDYELRSVEFYAIFPAHPIPFKSRILVDTIAERLRGLPMIDA
ncbi:MULTISPECIES: LysR family transcriptional regulator [Vibrio]|uniref:Bacterial regulatory protein, LysR n=1 Tax=Vibrio nigripulchritudo SOn1 TaxID=1238450 RepID=A0AAV2VZ35_9VIBR|nr:MULTISPECIES: LysR family transcriptional regulator [Vibrio]KJY76280.1 hypothetical protein TW74_14450 [Vibrio nigripulchritudo]UAB72291.1 LysR family transcriptional regulator [Vibrio sp. SCSIO 43132]CCN69207.1 putative Bacterial regulatory protein, LysR [Vibrio nigripulchritudo SFn118]CCO49842.1 putative Bacterial regulatory protein, LysR [Vibrio nigripulchritudo SOn1]BCL72627.1 LysR family transcriptional regulator [Vibrio nigripulchritudo]